MKDLVEKSFVYILKCADETLYTGYTNNICKRIKTHNDGKGAKYTRGRLPVVCVYFETFDSKSEALSREHAIKKLPRSKKESLILNFNGKLPL